METKAVTKKKKKQMETWYLLYEGISIKDFVSAWYCGRTVDIEVVKKHYEKGSKKPHWFGKVMVATDKSIIEYGKDVRFEDVGSEVLGK